ncbi:hypothetical protein GCM10027435_02630 [Haloparvum alkalitolerans]
MFTEQRLIGRGDVHTPPKCSMLARGEGTTCAAVHVPTNTAISTAFSYLIKGKDGCDISQGPTT